MTTFNQRLDSMKESLASLFKSRRSKSGSHRSSASSAGSGSNCESNNGGSSRDSSAAVATAADAVPTANKISTPQNVRRVLHITFDARRKSFDGIPDEWRQYFEGTAPAATAAGCDEDQEPPNDDSGVSMATNLAIAITLPAETPAPEMRPKEMLSLTYDRSSCRFVDLPPHWLERLERNNLLQPEFQKNPDLLVSVFAMMDAELKAMSQEGFSLDKGMYSSSPDLGNEDSCRYVYSIEADQSNSSSEQDLKQTPTADVSEQLAATAGRLQSTHRRPSLVRVRAVALPKSPQDSSLI